ncbi:MAG: hypothetical protein R6U65_05230 [Perlabentimonas sp.]
MKHEMSLLIAILLVAILIGNSTQGNKISNYNGKDTLRIEYADTILIGKQIFPSILNTNHLKQLVDERVLLTFESGNYYYVFFNKKEKINFLSTTYWDKLTPKYLNSSDVDNFNYSRFTMVDYSDGPFLTGFYNLKDSIIVTGSNLERSYIKDKDRIQVNYFSTSDTLLKLNDLISVGYKARDVITELQIPLDHNLLKQKGDFKIALMVATSLIDNAWYSRINPDCCLDYSVTIVLSFTDNKLVQIQYLDLEYIYYVFRQKDVLTNDIHYH